MPSIRDPYYGCVYTFKGRGDSLITMQNKLILPGRIGQRIKTVPLQISIHRSHLRVFLEPIRTPNDIFTKITSTARLYRTSWQTNSEAADLLDPLSPDGQRLLSDPTVAQHLDNLFFSLNTLSLYIAFALEELSKVKPRKGSVSRVIFERLKSAKVSIPYEYWGVLNDFFVNRASALSRDGIEYLSLMITACFLWGPTLRRAIHPAHGRWAGKPVLGDYLPEAYFACYELMRFSKSDSRTRDLIEKVLDQLSEKDARARRYLGKAKKLSGGDIFSDRKAMNMAIVCLVYRAFHGTWQRYKIDGLPKYPYAFREYLYGSEVSSLYRKLEKLSPETFRDIREEWRDLYLLKVRHLL
jgi:hypothetical protein